MLLSIITINYNNVSGLSQTIDSITSQTLRDIEYIVIDGNSNDGSLEVIEKNAEYIDYFVSEPDEGVYNAMNKGIVRANGDYVLFMNSGDYIYDNQVLEAILPYLNGTDVIYGDAVCVVSPENRWIRRHNQPLNFQFFAEGNIVHQSCFIKKTLFATIGLYDESVFIVADWKFLIDAIFKYNATTRYVEKIIAIYDFNGISSQPENAKAVATYQRKTMENEYKHLLYLYDEVRLLKEKLHTERIRYKLLKDTLPVKIYLKLKRVLNSR